MEGNLYPCFFLFAWERMLLQRHPFTTSSFSSLRQLMGENQLPFSVFFSFSFVPWSRHYKLSRFLFFGSLGGSKSCLLAYSLYSIFKHTSVKPRGISQAPFDFNFSVLFTWCSCFLTRARFTCKYQNNLPSWARACTGFNCVYNYTHYLYPRLLYVCSTLYAILTVNIFGSVI